MNRTQIDDIARESWNRFLDGGRPELDFFQAGGHSMLLLRLAADIKSRHGIDLVLPEFLREPTLEGLAKCLNNAASAGEVLHHDYGEGERFIVCIPGSYGRAIAFEKLAHQLNAFTDEPVRLRCLELWNMVESHGVERTIEMVRGALRTELADPRAIGVAGYSLGGLFAFLEDFAAERPDLHLWLIDSYPPIPWKPARQKLVDAVANTIASPITAPGSAASSVLNWVRKRNPAAAASEGIDHKKRWVLHQQLGEQMDHPWSGRAALIALRHKPLWTPYHRASELNGLSGVLDGDTNRVLVRGPHTALLGSRVDEVARAIASGFHGTEPASDRGAFAGGGTRQQCGYA